MQFTRIAKDRLVIKINSKIESRSHLWHQWNISIQQSWVQGWSAGPSQSSLLLRRQRITEIDVLFGSLTTPKEFIVSSSLGVFPKKKAQTASHPATETRKLNIQIYKYRSECGSMHSQCKYIWIFYTAERTWACFCMQNKMFCNIKLLQIL